MALLLPILVAGLLVFLVHKAIQASNRRSVSLAFPLMPMLVATYDHRFRHCTSVE